MSLKFLHYKDLIIEENRQRQSFDEKALDDLRTSVSKLGLLQPLVIKNGNVLIAGERRLKVLTSFYDFNLPVKFKNDELQVGLVPCIDQGDIDTVLAKEMELAENLYRSDLTWQEEARAVAELHDLRSDQKHAVGAVQTYTETAQEVYRDQEVAGSQITNVVEAVHLAKHLADPDVLKAKSQKEAVKIVKKKLDEQRRADQALEFSKKESKHRLYHMDCLKFLEQYREGDTKFDILLTDPPYGVNMDECTSWDGSKHEYDDSAENLNELLAAIFQDLPFVMKDDCHCYMFCDIKNWHWMAAQASLHLAAHGFEVWPRPFIWYKGNIGAFPKPEVGPRYTYECVLYFYRGKKKTNGLFQDVIQVNQSTKQIHPAGKPVEVYCDLLRRSATPGDNVLDLFAGGGTIFPAAAKSFVTATATEMSEKYYNLALERLNETGE